MKLLWHSAAPTAPSGYGWQTALTVLQLQAAGHEVAISATAGAELNVQPWMTPGGVVPVFPRGKARWSLDSLPDHATAFQADAIATLFDAWVFDAAIINRPWLAYFPVDCERPVALTGALEKAQVRVAMSRFGQEQAQELGLQCEYAPHMYDPEVHQPMEPMPELLADGSDRFIVGLVAHNGGISHGSPPRKAFAQLIEGFSIFQRRHPDATLYIHADGTIGSGGVDLEQLRERYGIPERSWRVPPRYEVVNGFYDHLDMAARYSSMNVLLAASMGEGFGVPILEAQACGTPVVTGDWTAMSEITRTGVAIATDDAYRYHVPGYGDQYIVRPEAVADALETVYADQKHDPAAVSEKVAEYQTDRVFAEHWRPILQRLQQHIGTTQPQERLNRAARRRQQRAERRLASVK